MPLINIKFGILAYQMKYYSQEMYSFGSVCHTFRMKSSPIKAKLLSNPVTQHHHNVLVIFRRVSQLNKDEKIENKKQIQFNPFIFPQTCQHEKKIIS
jgi:hypothetical protein